MKKYILISLLILFSVTLLGQTLEEKGAQEAYKHETNTIFAVKDGKKFHAFKYGEEITYLGYVSFDGKVHTANHPELLEAENKKHMTESYFFLVDNGTYYLYFKKYFGDAALITSASKLTTQEVAKSLATSMVREKPKEEPKPQKEKASADDTDDDDGGVAWWVWAIGGWFEFRLFFGD